MMAGRDLTVTQNQNVTHNYNGLSYSDVKSMIAEEREKIAQRVWERAQEMLRDAGVQPKPTPLKTLVPLLQFASLEEDEYMRTQWASLLANAAASESAVHSAYPDVLRQLMPMDARFLDMLFDEFEKVAYPPVSQWVVSNGYGGWSTLRDLWERTGLHDAAPDDDALSLTVDNLIRLNLLSREKVTSKDEAQDIAVLPSFDHFSLTVFGRRFVQACRRPKRAVGA
jgi:hypothetical protein